MRDIFVDACTGYRGYLSWMLERLAQRRISKEYRDNTGYYVLLLDRYTGYCRYYRGMLE
jgi:hypothetical protein